MYLPSKVCLLATGPSCFIAFQKFAVTCEVCDTVEVELNTNPARQLASVLPGEEEKPVVQPGVGKSSESSESIGNVFLVKTLKSFPSKPKFRSTSFPSKL
jgi:hypothetical protein